LDPNGGNPESNQVILEDYRFYGFNTTCNNGTQYYHVDSASCKTIETYASCGLNTWKYRFLSAIGSKQNYGETVPSIQITNSQIFMTSQLEHNFQERERTDQMMFAFKEVSGNGVLIAKIDLLGTHSKHTAGVSIRQDLENLKNTGPLIASCGVPRSEQFTFLTRQAPNINSIYDKLYTNTNVAQLTYYVRLEKTGTLLQCSYSTDNKITWSQKISENVPFSGTFYAGVYHWSQRNYPLTSVHSDIEFQGFSGICNNRGDCKHSNGILDKCFCDSGYNGTYCEYAICNGVSSQYPTVCSGRGSCNVTNTCVCNNGYVGSNCEVSLCNNKLSNDSSVCSSRGSCISLNNCNCNPGYSGTECQYPICFEIQSNQSAVCSGKGTCISPDTCNCNFGYTGSNCETPVCNGFTNPSACSGSNGTCVSANNCTCSNGYTGTNCEFNTCFGKSALDPTVCNSRGSCANVDFCRCSSGYTGNQCQTPICYGMTDPVACFGENGTCVSVNNCSCAIGHTGSQCQFYNCFGKSSNDSNVCNSRGSCGSPEICTCNQGYTGNQCQTPICYGKTDPIACSGANGTCISPNLCSCPNYGGSECQFPKCFGILGNESNVCSSHGACSFPDNCLCISTYRGSSCEKPICYGFDSSETLLVCSGNGTCLSPNNCNCSNGYFGDKCQIYSCSNILSNNSNVCSSHGNCIGKNQCSCTNGYTGPNCEFNFCFGKSSNDSNVCSGKGKCINPDSCSCESGWKNLQCQSFTCADVNSCSSHGTCIGANNCSCTSQYTGQNCSHPICYGKSSTDPTVCSGNGYCLLPNSCVCSAGGYSGSFCNVTVCSDVNDCSSHGLCVGPNNCSCFSGWKNQNCSLFHCDGINNCSFPNGNCVRPNQCNCSKEWSGNNCNSPVCYTFSSLNTNVCSGNGNCSSPDKCNCKPGWTGNNCQFSICNGINATNSSVCNQRGSCVLPNNCGCNSGYSGNDCQYTICNGVSNQFSNVCSSNGNCFSPNNCNCSSQYDGNNCQFPKCYGISSNLSNSCTSNLRGICYSPNNCSCNSGYSGSECQLNICYGIISNNPNVCSKHGNCSNPNNCSCDNGYYGSHCEFSHLSNFIEKICVLPGCKLNLTKFNDCIDQGVSCYCNSKLNDQNIQISCDAQRRIISLKFTDLNLVGYLPNMKLFSALELLDLSINQISSNDTFSNLFSNSLKSLNLSYNSIQNSAEHYEISKQEFPLFSSLSVEGNKICGIFPYSWLMNSFSLSLKDHEKTFWCDQFNSASCSKLELVLQKYTLLPHETSLIFNYSTIVANECKNYLKSGNLTCQSIYLTNSKEFPVKSSDIVNNLVECPRNDLFQETDQIFNLVWRYNSSLIEKISSQVAIVNLKYSIISRSDPHLLLSNSTVEMNLTCDQNMTRYRKIESDSIYCEISNNNGVVEYYSLATPISKLENIVKCNINNESGNIEKRIRLVDSTKQFQLTTSYHNFWILGNNFNSQF
jgi:hypothetical protein